jgi:hypothetical protein
MMFPIMKKILIFLLYAILLVLLICLRCLTFIHALWIILLLFASGFAATSVLMVAAKLHKTHKRRSKIDWTWSFIKSSVGYGIPTACTILLLNILIPEKQNTSEIFNIDGYAGNRNRIKLIMVDNGKHNQWIFYNWPDKNARLAKITLREGLFELWVIDEITPIQ